MCHVMKAVGRGTSARAILVVAFVLPSVESMRCCDALLFLLYDIAQTDTDTDQKRFWMHTYTVGVVTTGVGGSGQTAHTHAGSSATVTSSFSLQMPESSERLHKS